MANGQAANQSLLTPGEIEIIRGLRPTVLDIVPLRLHQAMRDYKNLLYYYLSICLLLAIYAAYDIRSSYLQEEEKSRARVANSSLLISERIKGAFTASDYVLRDIISQVPLSDLRYPATDPARHARVNALLEAKVHMLPSYVTGADLTDAHCIVSHAYNVPPRSSIVGFDGSQREWCTVPQADAQLDTSVTHMFLSNTGKLEVGRSRYAEKNQLAAARIIV